MPARVPGDAHGDLMLNGMLPEPLLRDNFTKAHLFEDTCFWYRKIFVFRKRSGFLKHELVFAGLDLRARIWLNGRLLGETRNAFIPHAFDATDILVNGKNELVVRITNGLELTKGRPLAKYAKRAPDGNYVWLRKSAFSFGYDWSPRLITCGIWRGVSIQSWHEARIVAAYFKTGPAREGGKAIVRCEIEIENLSGNRQDIYLAVGKYRKKECCQRILLSGNNNEHAKEIISIPNASLWNPAGYGAQALYDVQIYSGGGEPLYARQIGLRSCRIRRELLPNSRETFGFVINGKPIYARGANWVPPDSLIGRVTPEKVTLLLEEAVKANFNMLRVWGGGSYESEHFYAECNRLGILIWQDYMYANALYPDDDAAFMENATNEAVVITKLLRNNPCIVILCGNNEIHEGYAEIWKHDTGKFYGNNIFDHVLPAVVNEHAPHLEYRPSSPYGGPYPRSEMAGDTHALRPLPAPAEDTFQNLFKGLGPFMSEAYLWNSPPNMASLKRYLKKEDLKTVSRGYVLHANSSFKHNELEIARKYISPCADQLDIGDYVYAMQILHAEHMGAYIGNFRIHKDENSGFLFWMYNDCWPTSGWTTHDYYVMRKPLYYYVRRAFAPVALFIDEISGGLAFWAVNDTDREFCGTLNVGRYYFTNGYELKKEIKVRIAPWTALNLARLATTILHPWSALSSFVFAELELEGCAESITARKLFASFRGLSAIDFHFNPKYYAHKSIQAPKLSVHKLSSYAYQISTDYPAFGVTLDEQSGPDDNSFDLMPWQKKVIRVNNGGHPRFQTINGLIRSLRKLALIAAPGSSATSQLI